ncbi:hypothetical protein MYX04_00130 [Nitrospiraceae bacterium AH_259_D15_M11_P09]|nr:hypothetical protein [Nitrospiraceae bacterium AH_259_D15_M11_P09]
MAEQLDPNDRVTLDELAISAMWEISALVEVLEDDHLLTRWALAAIDPQGRSN